MGEKCLLVLYTNLSFTLQMGEKCLLVLYTNLSFTERSKLYQLHSVIQLNAVLHTRLFSFPTMCNERCVVDISSALTAIITILQPSHQ